MSDSDSNDEMDDSSLQDELIQLRKDQARLAATMSKIEAATGRVESFVTSGPRGDARSMDGATYSDLPAVKSNKFEIMIGPGAEFADPLHGLKWTKLLKSPLAYEQVRGKMANVYVDAINDDGKPIAPNDQRVFTRAVLPVALHLGKRATPPCDPPPCNPPPCDPCAFFSRSCHASASALRSHGRHRWRPGG